MFIARSAVVLLGIALLTVAPPVRGESVASCPATAPEPAVVERVIDGDTIALNDGPVVRLAGIAAPKGEANPTLAEAARRGLESLVLGKVVLVGNRDGNPDRYGRLTAQLFLRDGGMWIEGEMLRRGLARVFTLRDRRACGRALLAAEDEGRAGRAGLWADPGFAIRAADDSSLLQAKHLYQIVEGRVLSMGRTAGAIYLDFGRDWSTDFTVTVNAPDAPFLEAEGLQLDALPGRRVRVRGWLEEWNGPTIRVDHPEQIEVLGK